MLAQQSARVILSRWIKTLRRGEHRDSFSTPITVIKDQLSYNPLGVLFDMWQQEDPKNITIDYKTKGKMPKIGYRVVKMTWKDSRVYLTTLPHDIYKAIGVDDELIYINLGKLKNETLSLLLKKLKKNSGIKEFATECDSILGEIESSQSHSFCFLLTRFSHCGITNKFVGRLLREGMARHTETVSDDIKDKIMSFAYVQMHNQELTRASSKKKKGKKKKPKKILQATA